MLHQVFRRPKINQSKENQLAFIDIQNTCIAKCAMIYERRHNNAECVNELSLFEYV